MQAQCWFGSILLGVQDVTTLFMELAGGFSAFSLNINTTVLAAPLGSSFRESLIWVKKLQASEHTECIQAHYGYATIFKL